MIVQLSFPLINLLNFVEFKPCSINHSFLYKCKLIKALIYPKFLSNYIELSMTKTSYSNFLYLIFRKHGK